MISNLIGTREDRRIMAMRFEIMPFKATEE